MAYQEVELTITSAKDLKNVNWRHGPIRPYVVVWVDPNNKCSSRVDDEGDTCPFWDQRLVIPLPSRVNDDTILHIDVVHAGREEDTKPLIGSARLKLIEVLEEAGVGQPISRSLKLKRPSGRPHGKIDVEVMIRDPRYRGQDAYYAPPYGVSSRDYAPPYGVSSRDYAPPPPQYGAPYGGAAPPPAYAAAPPSGYPYGAGYNQQPPPPQYGYEGQGGYGYGQPGYGQPAVVEEKKKSKFGMGTGLAVGAVGGLLGGLAISEGIDAFEDHVADEAAERVEDNDDGNYYEGDDF
ncbi:uncharacterized protein [Rutidosis leptorrhynchoides]|uniref:uncharacterized protein n=1 Tax=Rutidosis leptorrhynchoides TaxID=125765 RepID=UPI003A99EC52